MCYTSAAAAKAGAIQALRSGILILLVPVVLMCGVIAVVIFRRRNQFDEDMDWTEEEDRELRSLFARMGPVEQQEAGSREVESRSPVSGPRVVSGSSWWNQDSVQNGPNLS